MRNNLKVPLAVGAGYLLGRKRKMRLAVAVAAGAATGSLGGVASRALKFGGKQLASSDSLSKFSPEFGQVADTIRGDLANAGKTAAKAAITSRMDVLASSLHDRTQAMARQPEAGGADGDRDRDRDSDGEGQEAHADQRRSRDQDKQSDDRGRPSSRERGRPGPSERPGPRERSGAQERPGPRERSGARERPGPRERRMRDSAAEVDDR